MENHVFQLLFWVGFFLKANVINLNIKTESLLILELEESTKYFLRGYGESNRKTLLYEMSLLPLKYNPT